MKTYLVGGAVRDQLLSYPVKERDWVVVGATPQVLQAQGFRQVGRDFPVFLHPETGEEYALARTERKAGKGYHGFTCDFNPLVSLEEDLLRRDLTINAIAMDGHGTLIDPYNGIEDLRAKKLRHVSAAFIEDPVRVLRVARFAARYHHLGFTIAEETLSLMQEMVSNSELSNLVAERVWQEWQRSLTEKNPEIFLTTLRACGALTVILPEIDILFGIPNPPKYHPEIDTGIHSLMVLQEAVKLSCDPRVRFAALVHDLGKGTTPMSAWPKHHGHELRGVQIIRALAKRLKIPAEYRDLGMRVAQYHLLIHKIAQLRASTIVKIFDEMDAFRRPQLFADVLLVCQADFLGRAAEINYPQRQNWQFLLAECAKIPPQQFIEQGLQGVAIKEALHHERIKTVGRLINQWKADEK